MALGKDQRGVWFLWASLARAAVLSRLLSLIDGHGARGKLAGLLG